MAQFSDLSVELLLHIASFLQVNRPGNSTQSTRETMLESERVCVSDASRAVREARASLFNLASVNKTLRRLLFEESYRVVSIHGEDGANKLVNLLRTLYNNPAISNSIKEFVLHIEVEDTPKHISLNNMTYLLSPDLPRLFNFNEAGEDDQQTYLAELDRLYNQNAFIRSSKYILWAAGLVLSRLTRITDLTLSVRVTPWHMAPRSYSLTLVASRRWSLSLWRTQNGAAVQPASLTLNGTNSLAG